MAGPLVIVHPDKTTLGSAIAARLITAVLDAQSRRGRADVVLTGGSMGAALMTALADSPAAAAIDTQRLHIWWGDERYLPTGDPERNDTTALEGWLGGIPAGNVHAIAGPDSSGSAEESAEAYAAELASAARGSGLPGFDVLMLGVGPDAHVASLFPGHPAQEATGTTTAVHDSPKPPPDRVSLTFEALCSAEQVWFLVSGDDKAKAVAKALGGADRVDAPAAGVSGRERTLWLLDQAAASRL
ncbi:MAG: 6-phosphogluconolactonase [Micrococcales bacterium]|nr:6-phosphogluconolactonase [Micrococcales bacterium]